MVVLQEGDPRYESSFDSVKLNTLCRYLDITGLYDGALAVLPDNATCLSSLLDEEHLLLTTSSYIGYVLESVDIPHVALIGTGRGQTRQFTVESGVFIWADSETAGRITIYEGKELPSLVSDSDSGSDDEQEDGRIAVPLGEKKELPPRVSVHEQEDGSITIILGEMTTVFCNHLLQTDKRIRKIQFDPEWQETYTLPAIPENQIAHWVGVDVIEHDPLSVDQSRLSGLLYPSGSRARDSFLAELDRDTASRVEGYFQQCPICEEDISGDQWQLDCCWFGACLGCINKYRKAPCPNCRSEAHRLQCLSDLDRQPMTHVLDLYREIVRVSPHARVLLLKVGRPYGWASEGKLFLLKETGRTRPKMIPCGAGVTATHLISLVGPGSVEKQDIMTRDGDPLEVYYLPERTSSAYRVAEREGLLQTVQTLQVNPRAYHPTPEELLRDEVHYEDQTSRLIIYGLLLNENCIRTVDGRREFDLEAIERHVMENRPDEMVIQYYTGRWEVDGVEESDITPLYHLHYGSTVIVNPRKLWCLHDPSRRRYLGHDSEVYDTDDSDSE